MRLALAAAILALAVGALVVLADTGGDQAPTAPSPQVELRTEPLEPASPALLRTCRMAASAARVPARCPAAIPLADGAWGRVRALDRNPCEYLIDVEPGRSRFRSDGVIFHLMFGGRCGRFDLTTDGAHWPKHGFFANDLRLVGVAPREPGQSPDELVPVRARLLARTRIGDGRALILSYSARQLTTVHSGHLAIVWNERRAGYVVSGHPSDPRTADKTRRTIRALRDMALSSG